MPLTLHGKNGKTIQLRLSTPENALPKAQPENLSELISQEVKAFAKEHPDLYTEVKEDAPGVFHGSIQPKRRLKP